MKKIRIAKERAEKHEQRMQERAERRAKEAAEREERKAVVSARGATVPRGLRRGKG